MFKIFIKLIKIILKYLKIEIFLDIELTNNLKGYIREIFSYLFKIIYISFEWFKHFNFIIRKNFPFFFRWFFLKFILVPCFIIVTFILSFLNLFFQTPYDFPGTDFKYEYQKDGDHSNKKIYRFVPRMVYESFDYFIRPFWRFFNNFSIFLSTIQALRTFIFYEYFDSLFEFILKSLNLFSYYTIYFFSYIKEFLFDFFFFF